MDKTVFTLSAYNLANIHSSVNLSAETAYPVLSYALR